MYIKLEISVYKSRCRRSKQKTKQNRSTKKINYLTDCRQQDLPNQVILATLIFEHRHLWSTQTSLSEPFEMNPLSDRQWLAFHTWFNLHHQRGEIPLKVDVVLDRLRKMWRSTHPHVRVDRKIKTDKESRRERERRNRRKIRKKKINNQGNNRKSRET